jgi:hypothetical protein
MTYPDDDRRNDATHEDGPRSIWIRGAVMLALMFCLGLAQSVLGAMAVVQFLWMLITRERNVFLADFGFSLGQWMAETAHFLTGATERRPFPFNPWPPA